MVNDKIKIIDIVKSVKEMDKNFIPSGTTITVKLDGSGDFDNIQEAFNSLTGKYSNGPVFIHVSEGDYSNVASYMINGSKYNIPMVYLQGEGPDKTIISTEPDGGNFRFYFSNGNFAIYNCCFNCINDYSPLVLGNFTGKYYPCSLYFENCKFNHGSVGINIGDGCQATFNGTNTFSDFTSYGIMCEYDGLVTFNNGSTTNFTNPTSKGTALRANHCGKILSHGGRVNYTNCTSTSISNSGIIYV